MAIDYPRSATIFAAICACVFVVIGVAGKFALFFFLHSHTSNETESQTIYALRLGCCSRLLGWAQTMCLFSFAFIWFKFSCLFLNLDLPNIDWISSCFLLTALHRQSNHNYRSSSTSKTPRTRDHRFCFVSLHFGFIVLLVQHATDCRSVYCSGNNKLFIWGGSSTDAADWFGFWKRKIKFPANVHILWFLLVLVIRAIFEICVNSWKLGELV